MALPPHIVKRADRYEPIDYEGFTLYPIKVREFEEFSQARPAIEFMQQSLPTAYWGIPLLSAFFKIDIESVLKGELPLGMFARAVQFLVLALRLGDGYPMDARMKLVQPIVDPNDPSMLLHLKFVLNGEEQRTLTPSQFQRIREILALQNGIDLTSDEANPELVEAERDIADAKGVKLDFSLHTMLSTVSTLSGKSLKEMDDWTVRELLDKQNDWNRILRFMVCGIAEGSGASWKGGNPYPSPFFERLNETSSALISMDDFAGGAGYQAMQNASSNN